MHDPKRLLPFLLFGIMAVVLPFARAQPSSPTQQNVTTYLFDNYQSGVNANESILRPANVTNSTFGQLFSSAIDAPAYAQPLYLSNLTVNGAKHNVAYVVTMHDSVYAFDADTGAQLWHDSFVSADPDAAPLITSVPASDLPGSGNSDVDGREVGIESTPVIDPATGTIYVVAKTKETGRGDGNIHYVQRLHALAVATGAEKFGGPRVIGDATCNNSLSGSGATFDFNLAANPQTPSVVSASTTADNYLNGRVYFNALRNLQRCSLTLSNGVVYVAWASHGDARPYHGWLVGFRATTLQPLANMVFCDTPDGSQGGIWQGGAGPTVDNNGNIFISTANAGASYCANQTPGDIAESFLKFNPASGLNVTGAGFDFWAPGDAPGLGSGDSGVGSGGLVLVDVPGTTVTHLCMAGGKNGKIYVVNRDNMGHFVNGGGDNNVQTFAIARTYYFGCPVYFNNCLFFDGNNIQGLTFNPADSTFAPSGSTNYGFSGRGAGFVISANGTTNGIIWSFSQGVLKAVQPDSIAGPSAGSGVAEFFQTPLGDRSTVKFTHPIVINGKVYAANKTAFLGFGLLNAPKPSVTIAATQSTAMVGGQPGTLTINRAGSTLGNLLITYAISGTARNGTDYTVLSGTATVPDGATTTTVTINPLASSVDGSVATVKISANANYTVGATSQASVTISDPASANKFAAWQQNYFGAQAGSASAASNADFDHDGLPNILEYALGTNPTKSQTAAYAVSVESNRFKISFKRVVPPDPNLVIQVSASTTLATGSWAPLATKTGNGAWMTVGGVTVTDNASTGDVTVTDSQTIDSSTHRFLRITASYAGN